MAGHAHVTVLLTNGLAVTSAVITKWAQSKLSCKRDEPVMQPVSFEGQKCKEASVQLSG